MGSYFYTCLSFIGFWYEWRGIIWYKIIFFEEWVQVVIWGILLILIKIALILMRDKDETKRERTIIRVLREKERQVFGDDNKNMYKINYD